MLAYDHGARCHHCGEEVLGAIVQHDRFACAKCGRDTPLCDRCRANRRCRFCGRGSMESAQERMEKRVGHGHFMF